MDFKIKIVAMAAVLLLVVGGLVAASYLFAGTPGDTSNGSLSSETYHEADFSYGPQAWVPYASHLSVVPGSDVTGNNTFKLMFVDLNVSSRQAGSNNNPVVIEYDFKDLAGTAAFHAYGYNGASTNGGGIAWTNRVDGTDVSGFYVTGSPGTTLSSGTSMIDNHAYVKVSNRDGPSHDDYGNGTYYLNFNKPGGGLNSLGMASAPDKGKEVCMTTSQSGTFYVIADSDNGFDDVLLLVAVNSTQSTGFELTLKAYPYTAGKP